MSHTTIAIENSCASSKYLRKISNVAKPSSSNRPTQIPAEPSHTFEPPESLNTFRRPGTLPQNPNTSGTVRNPICGRVPHRTWFSEPHTKDLVPELIPNLLDKPRSPPKKNYSKNSPEVPEPGSWNRPKLATPKPYVDGKYPKKLHLTASKALGSLEDSSLGMSFQGSH